MTNRELYSTAVSNWGVSTFADLLPSINILGFNLGNLKYAASLASIPLKRKIFSMAQYLPDEDVPEFIDQFIALSIKESDTKGGVELFGVTLKRSDFEDLRKHVNEVVNANKPQQAPAMTERSL